jgi:flagellar biosynthesis/type III secretory pathway protein FliH
MLVAIAELAEDQRLLYWAIVESALGEAARKAFEMLPQNQRFMSETQRRSFAEGEARGEVKGMARGEAKGMAEAVLRILARRAIAVSDVERRRILECGELETLGRWLDRALTIASIDQLFE